MKQAAAFGRIQVEGLKEFQRDLKRQTGKLPKAIGEAHKNVGRFIVGKLPPGDPHAVGAGAGATVRPSATKREVLLMAGSAARVQRAEGRAAGVRAQQWGRREVRPFTKGRPYIVGVIEEYQEDILEEFLEQTVKALSPAFHSHEIT